MATVGYSGSFLGPPVIGAAAELLTLRVALGLIFIVGLIMLLLGRRVAHETPPTRFETV
jgi:hypothetical protein